MGIQVVTIDKQHVCPMKDGSKAHKGGIVTEGVSGVFIDGKPVATVGSKCQCCSPKENSITSGAAGVLIDGKPMALVGSQTEHGGNVVEGVPGVTVSGGFATRSDEPEDFEPRIFNLQWKKEDNIIREGPNETTYTISADTIGYNDGDEISIEVYDDEKESIDKVKGTVRDGRIEIEWTPDSKEEENV